METEDTKKPEMAPIEPRTIVTVREKSTYLVPLYEVTDNGLVKSREAHLHFVKGDKANPETFRQEGFMSETLIVAVRKYLEENNVGPLQNHYTDQAIHHLSSALHSLNKRQLDRIARGVEQTHKP